MSRTMLLIACGVGTTRCCLSIISGSVTWPKSRIFPFSFRLSCIRPSEPPLHRRLKQRLHSYRCIHLAILHRERTRRPQPISKSTLFRFTPNWSRRSSLGVSSLVSSYSSAARLVAEMLELPVKRAKNPSLAQLSGIVLQETQSTFKIVTTANAIKSQSISSQFY